MGWRKELPMQVRVMASVAKTQHDKCGRMFTVYYSSRAADTIDAERKAVLTPKTLDMLLLYIPAAPLWCFFEEEVVDEAKEVVCEAVPSAVPLPVTL